MEIILLLAKHGPMTTSRAAKLLEKRGISPEAARQRVFRRSPEIDTLRGLTFPKRARFIYLNSQFGTDQYWSALIAEIQEMNPAYAAALAALRARGGLSLSRHFDIISGSPLRQKRQLASEVVLKNLESVGLVQTREIEGMGRCIVLGRSLDNISYRARKLRAVLMTEAVVLDAIRSWSGRLNLSSPNATRIRDEKPDPQFATFRFDLTGPSYLQPMVTYADSKPTPGFFVADVFLGVELNTDTVRAFLRKITMLSGFRKTRPFIPLLIAESFTLDALKLCRSKGIMVTRPETLFGQDVARALEDLLHTLTNTATSSIERLEKIFSKLSAVEGAAGNLRGALFELVVGHCVHLLEGGEISLGPVLTELKTGKQAEVDVLWERQRQVTAYECKGYRSPVKLAEVEKWLNQKVPIIHGALKGQDRYSSSKFAFEFWTASSFEPDAEDFLQTAKQSTRRYRIDWKNGVEFRKYAQDLKAPGLRKIIDDSYFKDILAHAEYEKDAEAKQPGQSQSRGDVVPNVRFLSGPSPLPDYSEEL